MAATATRPEAEAGAAAAGPGAGAAVTVVLGPVEAADRTGLDVVDVVSAEEMAREVLERVGEADVFVATAAVSDWRPKVRFAQKRKKHEGPDVLELVRTPDVLAEASARVHAQAHRPLLVGFAAETENVIANAERKLRAKQLDMIVANDVARADAGFGVDTNAVVILDGHGRVDLPLASKDEIADQIRAS